MNQKGFANIVLAGAAIFVIIAGVAGYLLWANKPKTAVPPVLNETADWKTYRNEKYGFEFKYPFSSELVKPGQPFLGNEIWLGYFIIYNSGQLSITVENQKLDPVNIYGTYGKKNINDLKILAVDNKTAYAYTEADATCGVDAVNVPLDNSTLKLRFSYCDGQNIEGYKNQILSTFKFIKKVKTADWKTYRNEKYGFEFKYPEDWVIKDLGKSLSFSTILINPPKVTDGNLIYNGIVINIDTVSKINTISDYLNKNVLIDPYSQPQKFKKFTELFPSYKIIKIDNTDWVQYNNEVAGIAAPIQKVITTALPTNNGIIEITTDKEYKEIYDQMLSTFKFTK